MKLHKYLFYTVNNKERGRGQRPVVCLMRGQSCLHHLHVLSTVFSWRPFSSFSLWIILLPSASRCFLLFGQTFFFLRCLRLRLAFVQSLFRRYLGRQSWRDVRLCVWPWLRFCLGVSSATSWFESLTTAGLRCFLKTVRLWFCVDLLSGQAAHELSGLAVHELSGSSGSRA